MGGGAEMKVRYNKLWKLLIDKGMKKSQLREAVGASKSTFAKLGKNENVTLPVLLNICEYLECDFGGKHNNREVKLFPNFLAKSKTINIRQHNIKYR